jgi:hypothetical protein
MKGPRTAVAAEEAADPATSFAMIVVHLPKANYRVSLDHEKVPDGWMDMLTCS